MKPACTLAAGLLAGLLVSGPGWTQNLLANGEFDSDLAGWDALAPLSAEWDPRDIDAAPTSGSALLTNQDATASRIAVLRQCIAITEPGHYRFIAHGFVPGGQVAGALVPQYVLGFNRPGCVGGFQAAGGQFLRETDLWQQFDQLLAPAFPDPVPANATIEIILSIDKDVAGESYSGYFDAVMLLRDPLLFRSGFE